MSKYFCLFGFTLIIILRGGITVCAEKRMLFVFLLQIIFLLENSGLEYVYDFFFLCSFAFFLYVCVFPRSVSAGFRYFVVLFILLFLMS